MNNILQFSGITRLDLSADTILSKAIGKLDKVIIAGVDKDGDDTFIWNLQQGEVLQDGRTIEEEKEAIAEDLIKNRRNAPNLEGLI